MKSHLTTTQAAARLGVTPSRVRRMIIDGVIIGAEKIGRDILIPESEIGRLEKMDRKSGRPASKATKL